MTNARRRFPPTKTIKKRSTMRATRPKAPTRNFTKKVKTILNRELETKKVSHLLGGVTDTVPLNIQASGLADSSYGVHIGNVWNTNNITVAQGTAQNQHVGRTITNCKLYLKACIQAAFYSPTNNNQFPFDVYCIVYKDKQAPNTNVPDQLKINDQGTAAKITGTPSNFMLPFNKSRYVIYSNRKVATFKPMPADRAELPGGSTLQNPTIGSSDNKAYKYFSMKLPCPKTLEFKAGSSNLVTNAHLGIGFYVINGSGAALGSSQIRATVFPTTTLYFKDS